MSANRPGYCRYIKVESSSEFFEVLEQINEQTKEGLRPILHFEAHGDKDLGLQIAVTGENISWSSLLIMPQKINKNTKNNLGVVMAACFGLNAIKPLQILQPCPFYFLIGADEPVEAGYIDEVMKLFYLELNQKKSLDCAMNKIDPQFEQFHVEKFFLVTFAKYMKNYCMGAGAKQRVENLLTGVVEKGIVHNRVTLRIMRKNAKIFLRSPKRAFNEYSSRFLHGRKSITFEDFQQFVRQNDS